MNAFSKLTAYQLDAVEWHGTNFSRSIIIEVQPMVLLMKTEHITLFSLLILLSLKSRLISLDKHTKPSPMAEIMFPLKLKC